MALEAGMPQFVSGSVHLREQKKGFMDNNNCRKRVLHRLEQKLELPKLTFPVITAHDCDAGPEQGDSEGHSRRAPALPNGNDNRRLHAGDSGKRAEDSRRHQRRAATAS